MRFGASNTRSIRTGEDRTNLRQIEWRPRTQCPRKCQCPSGHGPTEGRKQYLARTIEKGYIKIIDRARGASVKAPSLTGSLFLLYRDMSGVRIGDGSGNKIGDTSGIKKMSPLGSI